MPMKAALEAWGHIYIRGGIGAVGIIVETAREALAVIK
jgi:hypothetical protein